MLRIDIYITFTKSNIQTVGQFWHSKRRISPWSMRTVSILTRCKWKGCSRSRRRKRSSEEPNVQHRDFRSLPALMEEAHLFSSPAPSLPLSPILLSHPPPILPHTLDCNAPIFTLPFKSTASQMQESRANCASGQTSGSRKWTPLTFESNPSEPWIKQEPVDGRGLKPGRK